MLREQPDECAGLALRKDAEPGLIDLRLRVTLWRGYRMELHLRMNGPAAPRSHVGPPHRDSGDDRAGGPQPARATGGMEDSGVGVETQWHD